MGRVERPTFRVPLHIISCDPRTIELCLPIKVNKITFRDLGALAFLSLSSFMLDDLDKERPDGNTVSAAMRRPNIYFAATAPQ